MSSISMSHGHSVLLVIIIFWTEHNHKKLSLRKISENCLLCQAEAKCLQQCTTSWLCCIVLASDLMAARRHYVWNE